MRLHRLLIVLTAISSCLASLPSRADGPPPIPTLRMLNLWTFHATNLAAGFGAVPLVATNVERVASWSDEALQIDSVQPAWLRFREAETNGRANLLCTNGTVLFWFKPNWSGTNAGGSGPGTWARFLEVGTLTTNAAIGWWSLYLEPSGTRLRLAAQANGNSAVFLECPVAWESNVWHHVAVTYSPSNSALYLDGQWMTNGAGISLVPAPQLRTNGFLIGSDSTGLAQMRGQMDWLQTFNEPMSSAGIANIFQARQPPGWQESLVIGGESELGMGTIGEGTGVILDGGEMSAMGNYAATDLWLELSLTLTNTALVTVHNTGPETNYLLLSTTTIGGSNWVVEQYFLGATGQTFTTLLVPLNNRPALFFTVGSSDDADGDGLPDAYERFVTGTDPHNADTGATGTSDGYKDSDADGWCNLDELRNGTNPHLFNTPPPPQGVRVVYDPVNDTATISWDAVPASPNEYIVYDGKTYIPIELGRTTNSSLTLSNAGSPWHTFFGKSYMVGAAYSAGNSAVSAAVMSGDPRLTMSANFTQGTNGHSYLVFSPWNDNVSSIRLTVFDFTPTGYVEWDIAASRIHGGRVELTDEESEVMLLFGSGFCQWSAIDDAGKAGKPAGFDHFYDRGDTQVAGNTYYVEPMSLVDAVRFYDASQHLKQNLRFLLRAAPRHRKFTFDSNDANLQGGGSCYNYWARPRPTPGYEFSGFRQLFYNYVIDRDEKGVAPLSPFVENQLFRNFIFSLEDFGGPTNYLWQTGVSFSSLWLWCEQADENGREIQNSKYHYTYSGIGTPIVPAGLLSGNATDWIRYHSEAYRYACQSHFAFGWTNSGLFRYFLLAGQSNYFGLPITGIKVSEAGISPANWLNYVPGQPIPSGKYWMNVADPVLQTIDYAFFPGFTPMPGHPDYQVTNAAPVLIVPYGVTSSFAAWARQRIVNGDPNKFAYLEQYFDKAYLADAYGNITTNEAGVLSEYGDFFPTHAGQVFLTTKPDPDQGGLQGTATVHVVKLQLDVNHDGVMDLSFQGPDNTSAERPFRFWINNDCDWATYPGSPYFDPGSDYNGVPMYPDYYWDCRQFTVRSIRDLEDFARLWICGLPALTNASYQVTVGWTNVSGGNPAINLLRAVETNGGSLYLTDTNIQSLSGVPWLQADGSSFGRKYSVTTSKPLTLPITWFTNAADKFFLFEGAGIGIGQLVLAISQNGQVVAETSTWLDLRDVKDMYEQVDIRNVTDATPNALTSTYHETKVLSDDASEDRSVIVFVHGWRMGQWDYYSFSETMFKRLYWQGYLGRFASVRWPTLSKDDFKLPLADLFTYNKSEFRSHQSGRALANYLTHLRNRFPDNQIGIASHSMGGIITMQALRWHLQNGRQDIDNYVLMQAAVPAHCYDPNLPNYSRFTAAEVDKPTPDTYRGYPGAINGAVRNQIVNFYNTNDYALASGNVVGKDVHWEANETTYKPDSGFGYSSDGTNAYKNSVIVTDPRQIMSFVARPRSKAIGALPGVEGAIHGGEVDLTENSGFLNDKSEHSAQFNWTIQRTRVFYGALLNALFPPQ